MYKILFFCLLLFNSSLFSSAQAYKKLHFNSIVVDTHNDIPSTAIEKGVFFDENLQTKTHSDLQRMAAGSVDHVGLGSDFDGVNSLPQQIDDVTTMPLITKELLARGYPKKDIRKIMGGNFLRVFKANEPEKNKI